MLMMLPLGFTTRCHSCGKGSDAAVELCHSHSTGVGRGWLMPMMLASGDDTHYHWCRSGTAEPDDACFERGNSLALVSEGDG